MIVDTYPQFLHHSTDQGSHPLMPTFLDTNTQFRNFHWSVKFNVSHKITESDVKHH